MSRATAGLARLVGDGPSLGNVLGETWVAAAPYIICIGSEQLVSDLGRDLPVMQVGPLDPEIVIRKHAPLATVIDLIKRPAHPGWHGRFPLGTRIDQRVGPLLDAVARHNVPLVLRWSEPDQQLETYEALVHHADVLVIDVDVDLGAVNKILPARAQMIDRRELSLAEQRSWAGLISELQQAPAGEA